MHKSLLSLIVMLIFSFIFSSITFCASPDSYNILETVEHQVDHDSPPFVLIQGQMLNGFDIDLFNAIFENSAYDVTYTVDSFDRISSNVKSGKADTCRLLAITKDRKKDMFFTRPVLSSSVTLYARDTGKSLEPDEIKKLRVGVVKGYVEEHLLVDRLGVTDYETFNSFDEIMFSLRHQMVDGVIANEHMLNYWLVKAGLDDEVVPVTRNVVRHDFAFGVSKKRPDLVAFMNRRIEELEKEGVYEELYQRYFNTHSPIYQQHIRDRVLAVSLICLILLVILIILVRYYIRYLRKLVRKEQSLSSTIIDRSDVLMAVIDNQGSMLKFNSYAQKLTGYTEQEVIGENWNKLLFGTDRAIDLDDLWHSIRESSEGSLNERELNCKDGSKVSLLCRSNIIVDELKGKEVLITTGIDITHRKVSEQKLQESFQELEATHEELAAIEEELRTQYDELEATHEELAAVEEELRNQYDELRVREQELKTGEERYRLAVEGSNDIIWDWDIQKDECFFSGRFNEVLGYSGDEQSKRWTSLLHPDDVDGCMRTIDDYLSGKLENYHNEYRLKTRQGQYRWFLSRGAAIWDDEGRSVRMAGSLTDTTERKRNEEKINYLAYFDALTELPNRTLFMDRLKTSLRQARRKNSKLALLFLDLDNFKTINDTLGHDFGDMLLKKVGQEIRKALREIDTIARLGGDEFTVLLPVVNGIDDVKKVAERVIEIFKKPITIFEHEVFITTSIGITIFPEDGMDEQTLMKNADTAMYRAKDLGRNNYQLFTEAMNIKVREKHKLENNLRHALVRNEFKVYYQPIMDIKTGRICGLEALLRWNRGGEGLISPLQFIPLAEETGIILQLGEWVLREACSQSIRWQEMGLSAVPISVNLSARQFQQKNFLKMISNVLEETGLEPRWLEFEMTESIALQDISSTLELLKKLKDMGIRISLDDFGTGYSSLNYLKMLPIDTLKVDRSFIGDLINNNAEKAIITALIALAHSLRISVTAEGVETLEQYELLREEECDAAQGFLIGKPAEGKDIVKLLENRKLL